MNLNTRRMKTLIINIKQLVQVEEEPRKWVAGADMAKLGIIDDAYPSD